GQAQMTLASDTTLYHPAAITPWGGYVLAPYTVDLLDRVDNSTRWYVNPLTFLKAALKLDPAVPVPDVTTELGQRLLLVHIDGDGFVSLAERPGYPYAGQVLIDEILQKYRIPTTLSVIEGEIGPSGLHPDVSPRLEAIARQAFSLPWVEAASHTYSHPFNWDGAARGSAKIDSSTGKPEVLYLPIRGYAFNLKREIGGSSEYINGLLPPGKRVRILQWSGNCVPTPEALAETTRDGLLNINGGDTLITRSLNSWTMISGLGLNNGQDFQVYAPNQNENVYTRLWTGPFYGYERVIETFELTEAPYRFKPINIYYHLYAVTKTASLGALNKVYQWALKQPVNPVYTSEYIRKVLDFNRFVVARLPDGYRLRGDGDLRTVRLPAEGAHVDWNASPAAAGIADGPGARYLSLSGDSADVVFSPAASAQPYIAAANGSLTAFERQPDALNFSLRSYQPLHLTLNQNPACRLFRNGARLTPVKRLGNQSTYEISHDDDLRFQLLCGS
ncbi:MAG TPA: hypothetical protein VFW49_03480, partial [Fluviicoccus sp.]|nr:hypothetical protein [Fluviicoccus sp.]